MDYLTARAEIREAVIGISNKMEISQEQTVSILTYLTHDIMSIRENKAGCSIEPSSI